MSGQPQTATKINKFDEQTLPQAIGQLFSLNNYDVSYGTEIHGAEIDIIAVPKGNPFSSSVYIEATIQYVDVIKYGKDVTKFSLIREVEPGAVLISVSSSGFTASVLERAQKTRILTFTYDELFSRFEKFSPYVDSVLSNSLISSLITDYEQPYLQDTIGEHLATGWLNDWMMGNSSTAKWLVILGEYGTGKTSLTLVLRDMWLRSYKSNPANPIPIRIELKNFTRQFDAKSLLHHFLDNNELSHVPIEFMRHLIATGRVFLLLDGYDEMAQFLNARERRACLSALAELANDGARGILTSRPNYFTEAEELNVFDALYTSLEKNKYYISKIDKGILEGEKNVDQLLQNYVLNRRERYLRDLDQAQTSALVRRKLADDVAGQELVLQMLSKMFRDQVDGSRRSLGGKPVIVSFLLELIDDLRSDPSSIAAESLTEWQIYKLIIDRLMVRDLHRSPSLDPSYRRNFLQRLAVSLSYRSIILADEEIFYRIIEDVFKSELRRLSPEERRTRRDELFQDLRSSATLTRSEHSSDGWLFSHNSLREYLVCESLLNSLVSHAPMGYSFPVSEAMRSFVASISGSYRQDILNSLQDVWPQRANGELGTYLTLCWDMLRKSEGGLGFSLTYICGGVRDGTLNLSDISLDYVCISRTELGVAQLALTAKNAGFSRVRFDKLNMRNSDFSNSVFDSVVFESCDLSEANFNGCLLFECEFIATELVNANFTKIDRDSNFIVRTDSKDVAVSGDAALGYLQFCGAITDDVDPFFKWQNHKDFPIVVKICENIMEQKNSQKRGLTQRGAAQSNPRFARAFLDFMVTAKLIVNERNDLGSKPNSFVDFLMAG